MSTKWSLPFRISVEYSFSHIHYLKCAPLSPQFYKHSNFWNVGKLHETTRLDIPEGYRRQTPRRVKLKSYICLFMYLFVICLKKLSVVQIIQLMMRWLMNNWFERIGYGGKQLRPNLRYCPGIYFGGLRKVTKNRSPGRKVNPRPFEYEAWMTTIRPRHSLMWDL